MAIVKFIPCIADTLSKSNKIALLKLRGNRLNLVSDRPEISEQPCRRLVSDRVEVSV